MKNKVSSTKCIDLNEFTNVVNKMKNTSNQDGKKLLEEIKLMMHFLLWEIHLQAL